MLTYRKPTLKKVSTEFGSSFSVKHYNDPSPQEKPPLWHFHPEIEMVFVKGGNGKRHIGNHLSYYQTGDLILMGSMLPHTGFKDRLTGNQSETVIQFNYDCFGENFFEIEEMQDIKRLLQRAKAGIVFNGRAKVEIGARIEKLATLDNFAKLIELLCILQDMAWTEEYQLLNADGYTFEVANTDNDRINIIYNYVQAHFQRTITLEEIAKITNMTVPSFCRYFKRISGKKFTRFVNEIRIVHACKLLTEQQLSISNMGLHQCSDQTVKHLNYINMIFKN